jgi:hypothetical protein
MHNGQAETPRGAVIVPAPPPRVRRVNLHTLDHVRREAESLYREARAGTLPLEQATRLAYLLQVIAKLREASDIERRIAALEAAADDPRDA